MRGSTLDVRFYRRQILTSKVDPRAVRSKDSFKCGSDYTSDEDGNLSHGIFMCDILYFC